MQVISKRASEKHTVTYMEFKSIPLCAVRSPLFLPCKWRKDLKETRDSLLQPPRTQLCRFLIVYMHQGC